MATAFATTPRASRGIRMRIVGSATDARTARPGPASR